MSKCSAVLSEVSTKTEGKASRLMELDIVCVVEKQMETMDEFHKMKDIDFE